MRRATEMPLKPLDLNVLLRGGHWLRRCDWRGAGDWNRDGVGARVAIEAAGVRQVAAIRRGEQLAGDSRLRFGLASATKVDRLEVRWPSGKVDRFEGVGADRAPPARR